ncbi:54S ribosomal protein IMG1 [Kluyveromyces marxianus]|uniref:54S ribosomal protein IMG1 n=2 Tax=Kluyveromyces marxianus TaxID=4911 RepID=W0TI09_KLUMD|nr:54S ribosomal protein IMG1 [Kluyveromyces marxianus DMKU3-1042]QGN17079.1 54S ribosomal protein IMG1 [Kluyveromyces marxianus]BAO41764.1 54S ribosomal protein IMG1 [Kluyveromyces marxianus DMKU3-1042]BAP73208.1 54S ribosomal protein IMG1 [Kluyveromyces marxianus]
MFRKTLPVLLKQAVRRYQLPAKAEKKIIPVYPPVERVSNPLVIKTLAEKDLKVLDPNGVKTELISRKNPNCLRAGDVVRVVYDSTKCNYDTFTGYILAVDRKPLVQDSSILLRDHIYKTCVEMRVPIFSPLVERIDLIRRADGRRGRNKHYYIRNTRLDVGDLAASMRKKKHN